MSRFFALFMIFVSTTVFFQGCGDDVATGGECKVDKAKLDTKSGCKVSTEKCLGPSGVPCVVAATCTCQTAVANGAVCKTGTEAITTMKVCLEDNKKCLDEATPGSACTAAKQCTCQ
eukprot:GEMP01090915.1.p1 GENE.GEMP01090915.1~~GEMP01090915.1.p1  ORF type:complete len:137 (-),score=12.24 GEMP01090915.1:510-860(-)